MPKSWCGIVRNIWEENSLELDWKEREEIIRWETIPPADDDILGHVKVHIDQYFGVYTQLLTDDSDPDHPLEIAVILPRQVLTTQVKI